MKSELKEKRKNVNLQTITRYRVLCLKRHFSYTEVTTYVYALSILCVTKDNPERKYLACIWLWIYTEVDTHTFEKGKITKDTKTKFENWPDSNTSQALFLREKKGEKS